MKKIKVMLASQPKILSDVIRNTIELQKDMTLIGSVVDPIRLLSAIRGRSVDVVIVTPVTASGEPLICQHLLARHPTLKIVTQSAEGDAAYIYQSGKEKNRLDDPSAQSILQAIRTILLPATDKSKN